MPETYVLHTFGIALVLTAALIFFLMKSWGH